MLTTTATWGEPPVSLNSPVDPPASVLLYKHPHSARFCSEGHKLSSALIQHLMRPLLIMQDVRVTLGRPPEVSPYFLGNQLEALSLLYSHSDFNSHKKADITQIQWVKQASSVSQLVIGQSLGA
ncbi:hypothetical protein P886_2810 [Alteromonadaceae bacterium 2753L.S.0a.02]|nr:hypothetical protein P886_2810 [Alteromonadaceae bacterium 2753L.S.0a.02]